jgi:hypothetical protein
MPALWSVSDCSTGGEVIIHASRRNGGTPAEDLGVRVLVGKGYDVTQASRDDAVLDGDADDNDDQHRRNDAAGA